MVHGLVAAASVPGWQRWLLGIDAATAGQIERATLHLGAGWSVRAVVALLAAAFLWFGWHYLRDGRRPSLWVKGPLLALRLVALAALAAMLLQPSLRLRHSDRLRASVAVLVDTSDSMGVVDTRMPAGRQAAQDRGAGTHTSGLTRLETVTAVANAPRDGLLGALATRYNVRLYAFDGEPRAVALPASAREARRRALAVAGQPRTAGSTRLGDALRRAADDLSGQPVVGALVLSDGGSNLGEDPVAAAERARGQGMLVSTLGVGDPTPTRDLAVSEVLADQVVRKDNFVQVFAAVSHRGYGGRSVTVTLRRGGETVGTRSVRLSGASGRQPVAFSYVPRAAGTFSHSVSTSRLEGETVGANNSRGYLQRVIDRRLRVLYVEHEPRWEYRYLKNAVLRDTQVQFACLLTTAEGETGGEGNVPIRAFPSDEAGLFAYDIVVLGDVPRSYFNALQLRSLRRFVEDKGSSLVVLAGEDHMPHEYRGTPLEGVLPVVLPEMPEQVVTDEPYQWELTPAGRQDPLLRLADDAAANDRIWRDLPGMYWCAGVPRAKPGATVLVVNPARSNANGKRVVLAVQTFGAGRCLVCLADSTWRWRWKVGDRYFYRFWGQVIRSMTPREPAGGNRFAQVSTPRTEYVLGDTVPVHARLLDEFYHPVKAAQVQGVVTAPTGVRTPVTLRSVPGSPGLFLVELAGDRVGRYTVSVASPAGRGGTATAAYLVQSLALEQQRPELDETLLKRVAAAGGGRYYAPDQLARWVAGLKVNDRVVRSATDVDLWDAPVLLLLFIVPLALEWALRRRFGML